MEFLREIVLPLADGIPLALVQSQRQQFEVGNHVVQFGSYRAREDVVHRTNVAGVEAEPHGGRITPFHRFDVLGCGRSEPFCDFEVSEDGGRGQVTLHGSSPANCLDGFLDDLLRVLSRSFGYNEDCRDFFEFLDSSHVP